MKAEPTAHEMIALAHAVSPALEMLEVVAHAPVQGESMHKVIGYHAFDALTQIGWIDEHGQMWGLAMRNGAVPSDRRVYVIEEPASREADVATLVSEHVMDIGQSFTEDTWDVACFCGWERTGYATRDAAEDDWHDHLDAATSASTEAEA